MSAQLVPLSSDPNQTLVVSLNVDGIPVDRGVYLHYNEIAEYWVMTLSDSAGNVLLDSVPFVTGDIPAGNILGQFAYKKVGGATVINNSQVQMDHPNNTNLGSDFVLVWYDTPKA